MKNDELVKVIKQRLEEDGIAFTYEPEKEGEEAQLLDPNRVCMHASPAQLYFAHGTAAAINGQPLVFPNRYMAEGAQALIELITGKGGLTIQPWNEKAIREELYIGGRIK